jgi:hypothetical protein
MYTATLLMDHDSASHFFGGWGLLSSASTTAAAYLGLPPTIYGKYLYMDIYMVEAKITKIQKYHRSVDRSIDRSIDRSTKRSYISKNEKTYTAYKCIWHICITKPDMASLSIPIGID